MSEQYIKKNLEIRKTLQDIIDIAYPQLKSEQLEKYKRFFLEISKKQVRTYAGRYSAEKRSILIVGLNRPSKHILITSIHELSHHIDYCNRQTTDHQKPFYEIYERLIHAALDMNIISKEDIMMVSDVTDLNKIKKFLDSYEAKEVMYKKNKVIFTIKNGYEFRYLLSARQYQWKPLEKCWKKETSEKEEEQQFLEENKIPYLVTEANDINIEAIGKIVVREGGYEHRKELYDAGFRYIKEKKRWEKTISLNDGTIERESLEKMGLNYKIE